ncbi:MAG: KUP/HAK/KT family potassium transporter [Bacteroidetes bacterium]|nr:KUP/HAK/KT family potassium transporter [Bacteroidota bacterium]
MSSFSTNKLTAAGVLITLGIIFGDIGTSPIYVMSAILAGRDLSRELVLGGLSCVFWTLISITTFKYVFLTLNNDNKGEGGIFALYALLRRFKIKWVIFPAIIGCAALIADGFITPPISICSAVEGLRIINPDIVSVVPIVIVILIILFLFQQFGTKVVGQFFGPIMTLWFIMIGTLGVMQIVKNTEVLTALNPYWAIHLLWEYPSGFWILGAVFLCTTGAEALYSDLGHCGKHNIRLAWSGVLIALLLNYFGQGAYLLNCIDQDCAVGVPFYDIMPKWFLPFGVVLATFATIIASQAIITGCFTLVNEAMKLRLLPNLKVNYPTMQRGQIYIPFINWVLLGGCITVVLIFQKASAMEAAYGLAITIDMIMTTSLLISLFVIKKINRIALLSFALFIGFIEFSFFISNLDKFSHGGWFTFLILIGLFIVMWIFYEARKLRKKHTDFVSIEDYIQPLKDLMNDDSIPKEATNLVYLSMTDNKNQIDSNIIYSIFRKRPKRADIYWFVHVNITNEPYGANYSVATIIPQRCFFVQLNFGFKVEHKVNLMFNKIVNEMVENGEVDELSHYPSLRKHNMPADFKFILLNTRVAIDDDLTPFDLFIVKGYRIIKTISLSTAEDFGLEISNVEEELVPIRIKEQVDIDLERKKGLK